MQQDAMPFKQSPRSFAITVFTLTALVYLAHLFGKYALPPVWKGMHAVWVKERDEITAKCKKVEEVGNEQTIRPIRGPDLENTPASDEEVMSPRH
jgi:hypothetical protein